MRITLLAVPPVVPLIHDDLHMSEAEVGLLVGLPLLVFAAAAVPGSLLVARLGAFLTLTAGMAITALAGAGRGAAGTVPFLYAATLLMGFGIAIMQPALPALIRDWLPRRVPLGTAVSTNGMMAAVTVAPALTFPLVLPLVGGSWRLDLVVWSAPVVVAAAAFAFLAPRGAQQNTARGENAKWWPDRARWWPDWRSPLTWRLGFAFGGNNSAYYGANAFLPDYLTSHGRGDLVGPALAALNAAQLTASLAMLAAAGWLIPRRALPYAVFGPLTLVAFAGIMLTSGEAVVLFAFVAGFATAVTFTALLAAPALLGRAEDVHRTAAGMFTISYGSATVVPIISGALWDATGQPWTAFVPAALCAVVITVLGLALSRHPIASE
jgi:CP family cyanate transporter-like MFS transporter